MGFSFGFTMEVIHRYEFNRLIHGFSFGFTIEVILRYEFNRLIHGFQLGSLWKSFILMNSVD